MEENSSYGTFPNKTIEVNAPANSKRRACAFLCSNDPNCEASYISDDLECRHIYDFHLGDEGENRKDLMLKSSK